MQRKLKVTEGTRVTGTRHTANRIKRFPKIQLQGNWLRDAGYLVGEMVEVLISDQAIHIIKKGGNNGRI